MATPEEQTQSMINNLPKKTGKSLPQWLAVCKKSGLEKHGELVKFLKSDHGMTHGFANLVVHEYRNGTVSAPAAEADLVAAQYSGPKADLKPIYDRLTDAIGAFGSDVELAPKKAYVSLRRNKQFGLVQPSTKTRVDVGLNLKDHPTTDRLEPSGSFNAMVSHRVRLESADQVDDELIGWLRAAYEMA